MTWSFYVFFDLCLYTQLSKQSRCRWFEMPSCSLWCHCNGIVKDSTSWAHSQYKDCHLIYNVSIVDIRWLSGHLFFMIGTPLLVRQHIYIAMPPWCWNKNVLSELDQHHGCWCPGSLHQQVIRSHIIALQWCHNECNGVSNHQPQNCLLNCLFKAWIKENVKVPHHWPLWEKFTSDRWIPCTKDQ